MTSIFQIDWVFIDTIIIILLILLLVIVKIYKSTNRWRNKFSNQNIVQKTVCNTYKRFQNQFFSLKKCKLTTKSSLIGNPYDFPFILIIRSKKKRKLLNFLTEGLTTYGFNVLNLNIKLKSKPNINTIDKQTNDIYMSLISTLKDIIKREELLFNSSYILLSHSESYIYHNLLKFDSNNKGIILINPRLNWESCKNNQNQSQDFCLKSHLYAIFSKKSFFFLKNKHLDNYVKKRVDKNPQDFNILTIENTGRSFKYYETIILSMILDIIENEILKSTN
ncbi:MAG: hypothetical protein ACFE9Z_01980 [Promethearchaeota archaeon]